MKLTECGGESGDDIVDCDVFGLTGLDALERVAVDTLHEQERTALQVTAVVGGEGGADLLDLECETTLEVRVLAAADLGNEVAEALSDERDCAVD